MARRGGLGRGLDSLIPNRGGSEKKDSSENTEKAPAKKRKTSGTRSHKKTASVIEKTKDKDEPVVTEIETVINADEGVDEPEEVEYVYVDEDGNPVDINENPDDYVFVDENGNPILEDSAKNGEEPVEYIEVEENSSEDVSDVESSDEAEESDESESFEAAADKTPAVNAVEKTENPSNAENVEVSTSTSDVDESDDQTPAEKTEQSADHAVDTPDITVTVDNVISSDSESAKGEDISTNKTYVLDGNNETSAAEDSFSEMPMNDFPSEETEDKKDGEVISMRISLVEPNRDQPRKYFDDAAISELADSVRQFGVIQPLLVQKKDGYYEIIAGERRWRAAKKAGLKEVPVIVKNFSGQEAVEVALIENIQREDLNPIEEAKAYERLVHDFGLSQEEVAGRVSKSRSAVTNSMRLLKLGEDIQKMVENGSISEGHARAILGVSDPELQRQIADQIVAQKLSVRQTEKLVRELTSSSSKKKEKSVDEAREAIIHDISEKLKTALGTKVSIRDNGKRGKIEIEYYSDDELERIFDLIRSAQ